MERERRVFSDEEYKSRAISQIFLTKVAVYKIAHCPPALSLPALVRNAYNRGMSIRSLVAIPVFNEVAHVQNAIDGALRYSREVLVVDDGSTDGTAELLSARHDILMLRHPQNRGYGAALQSSFEYAIEQGYDVLVTMDCDGQHEPQRIPEFVTASLEADMISGSRYLKAFPGDSHPPEQRRRINVIITEELNRLLQLQITDAFCGFKAYRTSALKLFRITEPGYAMPLELWVQAYQLGLRILEIPVPLIYLEEKRSFGGALDEPTTRLAVYRDVISRAYRRCVARDLHGETRPCRCFRPDVPMSPTEPCR